MEIKLKKGLASFFFIIFVSFAHSSFAQSVSLAFSNASAQFGYGFLVGGGTFGRTEFGVDAYYHPDDSTYLIDTSLQVFDEVGSKVRGLVAGLGGKIYGASTKDDNEMLVIGVGGMLRYALPMNKRIILGVDAYYAPPVVSFVDANYFYELAGRLEYEIIPRASAFVEFRRMTLNIEDDSCGGNNCNIENSPRLGMEINF